MSREQLDGKPPKRRRIQFGLRSLLVLVPVVGCALGWLQIKIDAARRQEKAVDAIKACGGFIVYDYQVSSGKSAARSVPGPKWLRRLFGDDLFRSVDQVEFPDYQATDEHIEYLAGLKRLKSLSVPQTRITDRSLAVIGKLSELEDLDLSCTQITDDGVGKLDNLTHLKRLVLDRDWIKDTGAEHLSHHTGLEHLSLRGTQVSDAEVERLRQALPNCQIFRRAN